MLTSLNVYFEKITSELYKQGRNNVKRNAFHCAWSRVSFTLQYHVKHPTRDQVQGQLFENIKERD